MLVRLPNGTINKVAKIVPIIESYIRFNGARRLISEPITMENPNERPNGLKIYFADLGNRCDLCVFSSHPEGVTIGNLKPEEVEEISRCLLEKGEFDFLGFKFQKYTLDNMDYVIDNGVSNPYLVNNTDFKGLTSGINFECNNIFDSVPYSNVCDSLGEDSDDLEEGDEYDEDYDFITDED